MKECGTLCGASRPFPVGRCEPSLSRASCLSPRIARRSLSPTLAATFMPPCSSHSRRSLHDTFSNMYPNFFELAFVLRCYETIARRTHVSMAYLALGPTDMSSRTPAAPAGERGVTVWGGKSRYPSHSIYARTQIKDCGWSGPQVRLMRPELTVYRTEHLRPLAPNPSTSPSPRYAEVRDLGPRRAISGDLGRSRAISEPRRAISGDLRASLARRHTCSKKEGPGWSHGAHVLARGAASLCVTFEALSPSHDGEAAPRAARSSPSTPDPCAHRSS